MAVGSVMVNFHVEVEHLVEIEGIDAGDGHAQGVANEIADVMVFQEGRVFGEDRTLVGFFARRIRAPSILLCGPC